MRRWLLRLLRVEERPAPPPGSEGTLEVFHPSRRFLYYTMLGWAWRQLAAFVGIVLPLVIFGDTPLRWARSAAAAVDGEASRLPVDLDTMVVGLMISIEALALVGFVVQLVVSGLLLEQGWRLRWYMVSDESLRIREGLVRVREQTLRIANIQNIVVRQGPLQRLFRISDLEVHTAGGGAQGESGSSGEAAKKKHGHVGRFRGLEDAASLRDRLQRSLSRHRGAGLGDGGPATARAPRAARARRAAVEPGVESAVAELLSEAKALRAQLETPSPGPAAG